MKTLIFAVAITAVGCAGPTAVTRDAAAIARSGKASAAVKLAEDLLREARITSSAGPAIKAEQALRASLTTDPDHYLARRMLATALLSQHRFPEAIREAERCLQMQPRDAWPHGVIGDAQLELGQYDAAFASFERMAEIRPDAASYARAAYARELQGDDAGALRLMTMALEATSPAEQESIAWHHAQIGALHLKAGRIDKAEREYAHAAHVFPGHPFAIEGLARVAGARGRHRQALDILEPLVTRAPSPHTLAFSAELLRKAGRLADADRRESLAEATWRADAPDPAQLALFLAESGDLVKINEAVRVAEQASVERDDIFTNDALAWAYFKAGRTADAVAASRRARRLGYDAPAFRARANTIALQ